MDFFLKSVRKGKSNPKKYPPKVRKKNEFFSAFLKSKKVQFSTALKKSEFFFGSFSQHFLLGLGKTFLTA